MDSFGHLIISNKFILDSSHSLLTIPWKWAEKVWLFEKNEMPKDRKLCSGLWLASSWSPVEKLLLAEKDLRSDVCALYTGHWCL